MFGLRVSRLYTFHHMISFDVCLEKWERIRKCHSLFEGLEHERTVVPSASPIRDCSDLVVESSFLRSSMSFTSTHFFRVFVDGYTCNFFNHSLNLISTST